ncbi:MAG: DNA replication and repair protein RecF [Sphaerochaetaceae bacterium]|jgi:DNA replication and repair protein RecF
MKFCSLGFQNFRNLADSIVPVDSHHILLIGDNGQGKTNFLEALYVLCYGSSFRTNKVAQLATFGSKSFALSAIVQTDEEIHQQIMFRFEEGKREIRIDGKEIRDRRDLIYNIPCIVFTHDDIEFIRGEPEQRRRFFDQTMSLYDPLFFDDLRRYRLILRQRNAAIKEQYYALLPTYDTQLATSGLAILRKRRQEVKKFNAILAPLYKEVSQTDVQLSISYRPSWSNCNNVEEIEELLKETVERDIKMQTTTSGIHRDQFVVLEHNHPFVSSGSTGQMRLASLLLRIAQMVSYSTNTAKEPILLIDDVLLELDPVKRGLFLSLLQGYSQAFFTFLPDETYFFSDTNNKEMRYHVKEGRFELA